jgi:hypothetical protein
MFSNDSHSIYVTNISSQRRFVYEKHRFPPHSVPFDFDGNRLMWMEFSEFGSKSLKLLTMHDHTTTTAIVNLPKFRFSFAKLYKDAIIYVKDRDILCMTSVNTGKVTEIGVHDADVVALDVAESIIVTLDKAGAIYFWKNLNLADRIQLSTLEEFTPEFQATPFFGMGYPYQLKLFG